jgi:urea transport system substrate-binding protein
MNLVGCRPASAAGTKSVNVGILHSQTGTMLISETSLRDAELLAIDEINASGGVLGHQVVPVIADGRSRFTQVFPKEARRLLTVDKVAVVFGCWTSASRKAVLPVFEEMNGLLFYPLQYEGNESSPNIVYVGAAPNQQILPAIDWLLSEAGGSRKRFYLAGSDYIFPRTANFIVSKCLENKDADVVGVNYTPLGHRDYKDVVQQIREAEPDVIVSTINGDSNIDFYSELVAQGITADEIPVLATSVGEDELRSLLPWAVKGHLSAWTYFQSVDTPANRSFIRRFKQAYGYDCVTDDPIESAYSQVYLWKAAVEIAGSFNVDKVREAFHGGVEFAAPGGRIKIDPKTQHTYRRFRLGRVREDRQFDIVYETADWIAPEPYPQIAFPGWHCDWTQDGVTRGADISLEA